MKGKVVVVTGGFGALGRAVAAAAAHRGAEVAAVDFAAEPAPELAEALGRDVLLVGGPTSRSRSRRPPRRSTPCAARFGRIDALINVAGGFRWETVADGDPATWDLLWAMNVQAPR